MVRCLLLFLFLAPTSLWAKGATDVDHLALATVMLQDGHLERASATLDQVDPEQPKLDLAQYFTLRGVVALRQARFDAALTAFDRVVALEPTRREIHLSRARCAFALKQCEVMEAAFKAAGALSEEEPSFFEMRSRCAWQMKRFNDALVWLERAQVTFPDELSFTRLRVSRMLELGLFREAANAGRALIDHPKSSVDDRLYLAEALIMGGQPKLAVPVLERARLQHPGDGRLTVQLAHAWLKAGFPRTAAKRFAEAGLTDERYTRDAAEIYREHGDPVRALRLNGRILDQKTKLRQRLAILIDMERYEAITALAPRLSRLGLLEEDEELNYALAYAYFRVGEFQASERALQRLRRPDLFERATAIRTAMAECRRDSERCD